MGLDVVELTIRCEEAFSVELPDEELGMASTVGKLYDLICKKLELTRLPAPVVVRTEFDLSLGLLDVSRDEFPSVDFALDARFEFGCQGQFHGRMIRE